MDALAPLLKGFEASDRAFVEKLRVHADPEWRACGLLVALRGGDAAAARDLASLLARTNKLRLPGGLEPSPAPGLDVLLRAAPAGAAWKEAVRAEWDRNRGWAEGAIWLASEGVPEAAAYARDRLDLYPEGLRRYLEACLAPRDRDMMARLADRALSRKALSPLEEESLAASTDSDLRARLLAQARAGAVNLEDPLLRVAALLADPRGITLYRSILSRCDPPPGARPTGDRIAVACIRALTRLRDAESAPRFRRLLRTGSPPVRAEAARALADLKDESAIPGLVRLVDDPADGRVGGGAGPIVRVWHAAMEALEKLTGETSKGEAVADRRAFWRAWHAGRK
jgi:hypothetical protein